MMGIYKIENIITKQVYIGQSHDIERRWKEHKKCYRKTTLKARLYQAMRKYGVENFTFEVLEECEEELLLTREKYYIEKFDSERTGYNMHINYNIHNVKDENIYAAIRKDLLDLSLSQTDIAKKYDVSHSLISQINAGVVHRDDKEYTYPIRKQQNRERIKKYCVDCGKEIDSKSTRCVECSHLLQRKVERPSREDFKQMIRYETFAQIARNYNVSSSAIKKWCRAYKLPDSKNLINLISDEDWEKENFVPTLEKEQKKNIPIKEKAPIGKSINQLNKDGQLIRSFETIRDAARLLIKQGLAKGAESGIASHIRDAAKGRRLTAYGFKWSF